MIVNTSNNKNYFFVDGSDLVSDIIRLTRNGEKYPGKLLSCNAFINVFTGSHRWSKYHSYTFKRFEYFFPQGEDQTSEFIEWPDWSIPDSHTDTHITFCGKNLSKWREFQKWKTDTVPDEYDEYVGRAEKGVDVEICCSALSLASTAGIDRFFLYTNDSDFVPLFKALKRFGTNVGVFTLLPPLGRNEELQKEADFYLYPTGNLAEGTDAIFIDQEQQS